MSRKPKRERKTPAAPPPRGSSDRDKAIDAMMALLAEHAFEEIGLAEVAGRAYYTGSSVFTLEPDDPLAGGFLLR